MALRGLDGINSNYLLFVHMKPLSLPPICACALARAAQVCDTIAIASRYLQVDTQEFNQPLPTMASPRGHSAVIRGAPVHTLGGADFLGVVKLGPWPCHTLGEALGRDDLGQR